MGDHCLDGALPGQGVGSARFSLISTFQGSGEQRLQRFDIVRGDMAASTRQSESPSAPRCKAIMLYPALVGRQLYCGLRQSTPSSRQASCEAVSATTPSFAEGQINRPFSSRLA